MGKVDKAINKYEAAAQVLVNVLRTAYPIGSIVVVEKGRSKFSAEVLSAGGCWWSSPTAMRVMNLDTGKQRNIYYSDIVKESP